MGVNDTEPGQTSIRWKAQPEARPVFVVVWRGEKPEGRKNHWKEERFGHIYGESFRKMRMKKKSQISRKGMGLAGPRAKVIPLWRRWQSNKEE
jgi:hypothetical protein